MSVNQADYDRIKTALQQIMDYCDTAIAEASASDEDALNIFNIAYEALKEPADQSNGGEGVT